MNLNEFKILFKDSGSNNAGCCSHLYFLNTVLGSTLNWFVKFWFWKKKLPSVQQHWLFILKYLIDKYIRSFTTWILNCNLIPETYFSGVPLSVVLLKFLNVLNSLKNLRCTIIIVRNLTIYKFVIWNVLLSILTKQMQTWNSYSNVCKKLAFTE